MITSASDSQAHEMNRLANGLWFCRPGRGAVRLGPGSDGVYHRPGLGIELPPGIVRPDFEPAKWKACTRLTLDNLPPAAVARDSGVSESPVMQAKRRVFKRLRQEAPG